MELFVVSILKYKLDNFDFVGPSGVRALPSAAGINVGGHYKWHFYMR